MESASYSSIKIGGYAPMRDAIGANKKDSPFLLKFAAGAMTGGFGSFIGNLFSYDFFSSLMTSSLLL